MLDMQVFFGADNVLSKYKWTCQSTQYYLWISNKKLVIKEGNSFNEFNVIRISSITSIRLNDHTIEIVTNPQVNFRNNLFFDKGDSNEKFMKKIISNICSLL